MTEPVSNTTNPPGCCSADPCPLCGASETANLLPCPGWAIYPEVKRLRGFVQFVADCSNDPRVVDEAVKMGARR